MSDGFLEPVTIEIDWGIAVIPPIAEKQAQDTIPIRQLLVHMPVDGIFRSVSCDIGIPGDLPGDIVQRTHL